MQCTANTFLLNEDPQDLSISIKICSETGIVNVP